MTCICQNELQASRSKQINLLILLTKLVGHLFSLDLQLHQQRGMTLGHQSLRLGTPCGIQSNLSCLTAELLEVPTISSPR